MRKWGWLSFSKSRAHFIKICTFSIAHFFLISVSIFLRSRCHFLTIMVKLLTIALSIFLNSHAFFRPFRSMMNFLLSSILVFSKCIFSINLFIDQNHSQYKAHTLSKNQPHLKHSDIHAQPHTHTHS